MYYMKNNVIRKNKALPEATTDPAPKLAQIDKTRINTKNRIIDSAEELFAERGFVETSLRLITTRANVNLASVNYHFGSKKSLIQAVFDRYLSVFFKQLQLQLDQLEQKYDTITVEEVLETMAQPLLGLDKLRRGGTRIFMQLIGRAYAESQGHIRRFMMEKYGNIMEHFYHLIYASLPAHNPFEVFLRLHFTMGAVVFTFAGSQALADIAFADFDKKITVLDISQKLIPYLAAGLKNSAVAPLNSV